ncbi:transposase [Bifidobacterium animalis]|nr:transposase [Bifidobacterium animalis]
MLSLCDSSSNLSSSHFSHSPKWHRSIFLKLETLRGNAMGFANTTSYIQRCLIHSSQLKDILTH